MITKTDYRKIVIEINDKVLQPVNHPIVQYIPYSIQGTINRDIYKTIIKNRTLSLETTLSFLCTILRKETWESLQS